jgi:hypothetical protein
MGLTRRSESKFVYLEVKHHCLWRQLKKPLDGCDSVEVTNPQTGVILTKHGFRFDSVSGHVVKIEKYDTLKKYSKRYFGFKVHFVEGPDTYVVAMPYESQVLRRFLRLAHNINWELPLSLTVFKGKKEGGKEETGIWFQQRGETVKAYYTKDAPHGMPEAIYYQDVEQWDFKAQHRWLVDKLQTETMADIAAAAKKVAPPIQPAADDLGDEPEHDTTDSGVIPPHGEIDDDDVPF